MNQTAQNLTRLALLSRGDKKAFNAVRQTAKALHLPTPKRQQKQPSAATARLQNFVKGIKPQDLHEAIPNHGTTAVFNRVQTASIMQTAAAKFAALAIQKAGGAL